MKQSGRNIALILDNFSSHMNIKLSNIKLIFLPPNTTSKLQAMDMGIIHAIKAQYRKRLVRRMCSIFEAKKEFNLKDIELYEAISMLSNAWNDIDALIISNCFKKSGCDVESIELIDQGNSNSNEEWSQLMTYTNSKMNFEEYVRYDDDTTFGETNDTNETNFLHESSESCDFMNDMEESDSEVIEEEPDLKLNDAINAINILRKYSFQNNCNDNCDKLINKLENELYRHKSQNLRQTKITDYLM